MKKTNLKSKGGSTKRIWTNQKRNMKRGKLINEQNDT